MERLVTLAGCWRSMLLCLFVSGSLSPLSAWSRSTALYLGLFHACAALLVDPTRGSPITFDEFTLRCCRYILILSIDMFLGLYEFLLCAELARALPVASDATINFPSFVAYNV